MARKYYSHFTYNYINGTYALQDSISYLLAPTGTFVASLSLITHNSIKVSWGSLANVDSYRIIVNNLIFAGNITETNYTIPNLQSNAEHYIQVLAIKDGNIVRRSAIAYAKTLVKDGVRVVGTAEVGRILLSWNDVPSATSYEIYVGVPGLVLGEDIGFRKVYALSNNIYPDTAYLLYVVALDASAAIIATGAISLTTPSPAPIPPDASKIQIPAVSPSTISLRWLGTSGAKFYRVYLNVDDVPAVDNIFDTSVVVGNLLPGVSYSVVVAAVNDFGESRSNPIRVTTSAFGTSDLRPPILISPNDGFTTVDPTPTLYWEVPSGPDGKRYDFVVEIAEDPDFSKNVRRYNSFVSKDGFSFRMPRPANTREIVSFKVKDNLVKY